GVGAYLLIGWQRAPAAVFGSGRPTTSALGLFQVLPLTPYAAAVHAPTCHQPRHPTGLWVELPRLNIVLPVHPGDGSDRIPFCQALLYPGTVAPGQPGNSYLYAHGVAGMFGPLLLAQAGDEVVVTDYDLGTVQTLHVSRVVGRVRYNDVSWLRASSARPLLTLQTCVDYSVKGDRWIVLAA
ncbi:MAG TPA: sortase, partial [Candidatus Dormibacteraeota bacterium]